MMGRRNGEITTAKMDRIFPHQVALMQSFTVPNFAAVQRAYDGAFSACNRTKSVFHADETWIIFCFGERDEADAFLTAFDGLWFNPTDRGKGSSWMRWSAPTAGQRG